MDINYVENGTNAMVSQQINFTIDTINNLPENIKIKIMFDQLNV